jgi:hypothetical protein
MSHGASAVSGQPCHCIPLHFTQSNCGAKPAISLNVGSLPGRRVTLCHFMVQK